MQGAIGKRHLLLKARFFPIVVFLVPSVTAACSQGFVDPASDTTYPIPGPYDILSGNVSTDGLFLNWTLELNALDNSSSSATYWLNLGTPAVSTSFSVICELSTTRAQDGSPALCHLCRTDASPEDAAGNCALVAVLNASTKARLLHVTVSYELLGVSAGDGIDDMTVFSALAISTGCIDVMATCGVRQFVNVQPPQDEVDLRETSIEACGLPVPEQPSPASSQEAASRNSPPNAFGWLLLGLAALAFRARKRT